MEEMVETETLTPEELQLIWPILSLEERVEAILGVPRGEAEDFFFRLPAAEQAELLLALPQGQQRSWIRLLPPDDVADLVQSRDKEQWETLLSQIDDATRREVTALLAYAEDDAGGLMNPRYARVRPNMTLDEAISYLRRQTRSQLENFHYIYVLDEAQHLLGVVSFRDLFTGSGSKLVQEIMRTQLIKALEDTDQEALGKLFADHDLLAIPVVDSEDRLKGIVTVDDIVDVIQEEATEDIQKLAAIEPLDFPYMRTSILQMVKKRGGWLAALFIGEMLTATAMGYFEDEIAKAVVLALFVPLIISSGGNSGSQASTLVIRAMALGELHLRDWFIVIRRELISGLMLGTILGCIGFARIVVWESLLHTYGQHYLLVAMTVFVSLIGVVTFGTIAGSMLPFILRRFKLDPASASAPFVATLVDVTGLIIYFTAAALILRGALL
jgi:magnesium transporter